jgi:hypothetical protein
MFLSLVRACLCQTSSLALLPDQKAKVGKKFITPTHPTTYYYKLEDKGYDIPEYSLLQTSRLSRVIFRLDHDAAGQLTAMVEQWHKAERDALDRQKLSLNGLLTEYAKVPDSW